MVLRIFWCFFFTVLIGKVRVKVHRRRVTDHTSTGLRMWLKAETPAHHSCRDAACRYPMDQNMSRPLFFSTESAGADVSETVSHVACWPGFRPSILRLFRRLWWCKWRILHRNSPTNPKIKAVVFRWNVVFTDVDIHAHCIQDWHYHLPAETIGPSAKSAGRSAKDSSYPSRPFTPSPYTSAGVSGSAGDGRDSFIIKEHWLKLFVEYHIDWILLPFTMIMVLYYRFRSIMMIYFTSIMIIIYIMI